MWTEEQRKKQSERNKALWQNPEHRERHRLAKIESLKNPNYHKNLSDAKKRDWQKPDVRAKIQESNAERWTPESRAEASEKQKVIWSDKERLALRTQKTRESCRTSKFRELSRRLQLERYKDPRFKEKVVIGTRKAARQSPNKLEKQYIELLEQRYPGMYRFTGGGEYAMVVGGKCPDFMSNHENKIIEIFGDYWHRDANEERELVSHYKKYGYDTLIIWEHEDIESAMLKVALFTEQVNLGKPQK